MTRALVVLMLCTLAVVPMAASPPDTAFSPPSGPVPSLHAGHVSSEPPPASARAPNGQVSSQSESEGWEALRRETSPGMVGAPGTQLWRWLLGLAVALALIKWGLPRALNGGKGGQVAQWLTRLSAPKSEGTITVLDTRFLGAGAVHLITVRGRTLLVGTTAQQVNLLMDLTEPADSASTFDRVLAQSTPFIAEPTLRDEAVETEQVVLNAQQRLKQARERLAG